MKFLKKNKIKLIFFLIIFLVIFINLPYGRAFYKTIFLMVDLMSDSNIQPSGIFPKQPTVKEVVFNSNDKEIAADLYLPNIKGKYPAAILHLGTDVDRKDPRIQQIAKTLAQNGVIVLAPNLPTISNRRLTQKTPDEFIDSFTYLKSLPNANQKKLGFVGFCASGSMVLIASSNEIIKNDVAFIVAINPYYDFQALLEEVTLRKIDGENWTPHFKTVEIINRESIFLLENQTDRQILKKYLLEINQDSLSKGIYQEISNSDKKLLSQDGINTFKILTSKNLQELHKYIDNSTEKQKFGIYSLSPNNFIKDLKSKNFILVDLDNQYIPATPKITLKKNFKNLIYAETYLIPSSDNDQFNLSIKEVKNIFLFLYQFLLYLEN